MSTRGAFTINLLCFSSTFGFCCFEKNQLHYLQFEVKAKLVLCRICRRADLCCIRGRGGVAVASIKPFGRGESPVSGILYTQGRTLFSYITRSPTQMRALSMVSIVIRTFSHFGYSQARTVSSPRPAYERGLKASVHGEHLFFGDMPFSGV